ncbi:hypothetical protein SprV_1002887900 [Sparganum proliferum]
MGVKADVIKLEMGEGAGRWHVRARTLALNSTSTSTSGGEDPVHGATITAKAALTFRKNTLIQIIVQAVEKNVDDDGVLEILRDFPWTPDLLEQCREMLHELGTTVLVDLRRARVRCRRFTAGELLHGPNGLVERGWEVEVGVGLLLGQADDGGVGGGGIFEAPLNCSADRCRICVFSVIGVLPSAPRKCAVPLAGGR